MTRHVVSTFVLWALLTAAGEAMVFLDLFPVVGSTEAEDFDEIFRILLFMGIPVFCFAISVLIYGFFGFKGSGRAEESGSVFFGTGIVPKAWLAITGALAALVMVFPGLTGLAALQKDSGSSGWGKTEGDVIVRVTAQQFSFAYEFPQYGVSVPPVPGRELVLPIDKHVKFEIDSIDVIHSFWIPAFRMKIDAIPGRTTFMTVDTTKLGQFADDEAFRVQCAELCGLNHTTMRTPVRVEPMDKFLEWIATQAKTEAKTQAKAEAK